jgi:hypothetical protein
MRHTPYTKLSKNQLHNHLQKRGISLPMQEKIKAEVALRKKQINTTRVENQVRYRRWMQMARPLSREINTVRTNLKYHEQHNPTLHIFFTDYLDCLLDVRELLNRHKLQRTATPLNTDRTKKDWTDYVNPLEKADLTQRYLSLPYNTTKKHKEIFKRPTQRKETK